MLRPLVVKLLARALIMSLLGWSGAAPVPAFGAPFYVEFAVLSGTPVPGQDGLFVSPREPIFDTEGTLAFTADLVDAKGDAANAALRARPSGAIEVLATEGDPVPVGTSSYWFFAVLGFDAEGGVLVHGWDGRDSYLLKPGPSGALRLLAYDGQTAPGLEPADTFDLLFSAQLGPDGTLVFESRGQATGARGVWKRTPDSPLDALFIPGDPAPGLPGRVLAEARLPVLDRGGNLAFVASVWPFEAAAVYVPDGEGDMTLAYPLDEPAPGAPDAHLCTVDRLAHESGIIGLAGTLCDEAGGEPNDDRGVWAGRAGELALAARTGDAVEGLPAGHTFGEFGAVVASPSGTVAFEAGVVHQVGLNHRWGIWARDPDGRLRLLAYHGMKVRGRRARIEMVRLLATNTRGDILFETELSNRSRAIHLSFAGTERFITLVAKGDKIQVAPGRKGKVKDISAVDTALAFRNLRKHVFDDDGRFAVRLDFGRRGSAAVLARPAIDLRRERDVEEVPGTSSTNAR